MSLPRALVALGLVSLGLRPSLAAQSLDRVAAGPRSSEQEEPHLSIVFEGVVANPDGSPAAGAVVVTSAGGKAVVDGSGNYRLEARVPVDAQSVQITAVGGAGGILVASTSVDLTAGSSLARVGPLELASGSTCPPSWLPTFGGEPGTHDDVHALAVFDDGSGPALYAAGAFTTIGGVAASRIARWDGASWVPLGAGPSDQVRALAVFDDGGGPALYAAGNFTTAGGVAASRIAKWDGASWTALGSGMSNPVLALAVFDDGSGPALYAGGQFTTAGGAAASRIARWDGASWTSLGSGLNSLARTLTVFDDGSGPALYVGGQFTTAGGVAANFVARWDGASWTALGSGTNDWVLALTVFDDGTGPALYGGGLFTSAGGVAASRIARWDGASWAQLGSGTDDSVDVLAVFDDGTGPALHAGGTFTTAGGVTANGIARWNGSSWADLGSGVMTSSVRTMTVFDDGNGPALHVGGSFSVAGGVAASSIAKWDGAGWAAFGSGLNSAVNTLAVFDDGTGPALYAGGAFWTAGGVAVGYVAKWNGASWSLLGSGMNGWVYELTPFDDGTGPALYASGNFTSAGGMPANCIAKWDGASWTPLGSGMTLPVGALAVFDDGGGPALYAGGLFSSAGGVAASGIARWDGASWAQVGGGMGGTSPAVSALTVFDDGSGPALYAGGTFTSAGGVAANRIAKWNGASWARLANGTSGGTFTNTVYALTVFDDGNGPALYVGGDFTVAGEVAASRIARWNGAGWAALGSGMGGGTFVAALGVFDDGSGPALYAGGDFTSAGGVAASRIARWNGVSWAALGSGTSGGVYDLTVFNDRTGPALHAGGTFASAFDSGDSYLAKWGCPDTNPPAISCPPKIVVFDASTGAGEIVTFTAAATDEEDPTPSLVCAPSSGSLFPRGTTLVTCTATDFSGNQATCQFPVTVKPKLRQP